MIIQKRDCLVAVVAADDGGDDMFQDNYVTRVVYAGDMQPLFNLGSNCCKDEYSRFVGTNA